ncbi:MAG: metal ABC transporter ATP-binding protein [Muribaculaceae bacterium]|nr:metal ABC transporter ATP-binding protein [Muribaculaceae bacterium]MDE5594828.1 metal ABC transporter ATP-binding protein [Muribaculaceae bacterium]
MNSQDNHHRLISLANISLEREGRQILNDVSMDVHAGDFIAITGPNGGGKTTLLRVMLRLLKPDSGKVVYYNDNGDRLRIGYLPQKNMIDSHFPITVREVVSSGLLGVKEMNKNEVSAYVDDTLTTVGMTEHQHQPIGVLSGGQLQRALLGRAIISNPDILVLDEPLSYIDKRFEARFYDIISDLKKSSTIVLVSHEMTTLAEMANRHFIVDHSLHECTAHHHYVRSECQ